MKFLGVTILQGVEFSISPIDFEWALQQCSATALPVIRTVDCYRPMRCEYALHVRRRKNDVKSSHHFCWREQRDIKVTLM